MTGTCFTRDDGGDLGWHVERWFDHPAPEEYSVLSRIVAPVLDVGCGPGRHVLALARRGVVALGVDLAPTAVDVARERGAAVLQRSVFEPIPGAGRWGSALLLDGNIGIGGDPEPLLDRIAQLLRPRGRCLVEVDAPGTTSESISVTIGTEDGGTSSFPWAIVGAGDLDALGRRAGFALDELWNAGGRWFGCLVSA